MSDRANVPERLQPLIEQLAGEPIAAVVGGQVVKGVLLAPADAAALAGYLRRLLDA